MITNAENELFKKRKYIAQLLIDEASEEGNTTCEWSKVFDVLVHKLFADDEKLKDLSLKTKLAIAIIIVGAQNLENYMVAFKIMCDWETIGGCFWIVQVELMRHASLFAVRSGFKSELGKVCHHDIVCEKLQTIFPVGRATPPSYVTHPIVRQKMCELRDEMFALVETIRLSNDPWEVYVDYFAEYPLQSFVDWYLLWAQDLLRQCIAVTSQRVYGKPEASAHSRDDNAALEDTLHTRPQQQEDDLLGVEVDANPEVVTKENDSVENGVGTDSGDKKRVRLNVASPQTQDETLSAETHPVDHPAESGLAVAAESATEHVDESTPAAPSPHNTIERSNAASNVCDVRKVESVESPPHRPALTARELMPPPLPRTAAITSSAVASCTVVTPAAVAMVHHTGPHEAHYLQDRLLYATEEQFQQNVIAVESTKSIIESQLIPTPPRVSAMSATVSAIASMGSGLLSMLGPTTQYTSLTATALSDNGGMEEDVVVEED